MWLVCDKTFSYINYWMNMNRKPRWINFCHHWMAVQDWETTTPAQDLMVLWLTECMCVCVCVFVCACAPILLSVSCHKLCLYLPVCTFTTKWILYFSGAFCLPSLSLSLSLSLFTFVCLSIWLSICSGDMHNDLHFSLFPVTHGVKNETRYWRENERALWDEKCKPHISELNSMLKCLYFHSYSGQN